MPNRVLIAESDLLLLQQYRAALWRHGFEVATATDAIECVKKLKCWTPDLLVLDPALPLGGGVGVLACMHEEDDVPIVPVIVLSFGLRSSMQDIVMAVILTYPIDDYHAKPDNPDQLVEWVETLLKQRAHRGDNVRAAV